MAQRADFAFVTDQSNFEKISPITKCYYRSIPSPLSIGEFDVNIKTFDRSYI